MSTFDYTASLIEFFGRKTEIGEKKSRNTALR